ncbi:MAG: ASKHA domain-containing protein [Gammaproteobacteria bacterium]
MSKSEPGLLLADETGDDGQVSDMTTIDEAGSDKVTITFQPAGKRFNVRRGESLFEAAIEAGVEVDTVCGGNGTCGKCKVRFEKEPPPASPVHFMHLSGGEIARGYRLSCQVRAERDILVQVPQSGEHASVQILHHGVTRRVTLQPNVRKVFIPYTDPRQQQHVADWERLRRCWPRKYRPTDIPLSLLRKLPAAIRDKNGMTVALAGRQVIGIDSGDTVVSQYGVAFDIGSTTIVGFLIDLGTGEEKAVASTVNKQAVYGDDIIGRLGRAQRNPEGLARLHQMVIGQINQLLQELADEAGIGLSDILELIVVGNMAMHHFLLRLDSTGLGLAPYAPVIRGAVAVTAEELGLELRPEVPLFVLPNIAGFVGSDTVAVMLASKIAEGDGYRMAIDVGTNGEMALGNKKRIIACSAPAGPALEGARIKMGMRAAAGAIDHVWIDDDVRYTVIGKDKPRGICGSALIDIVAQLRQSGLMNSSGAFIRHQELSPEVPAALRERLIEAPQRRDSHFILARAEDSGAEADVIFTQQDVRECQLAKGAIRAGTIVLMEAMGLQDDDLGEVLLAGAFGNFLDADNALKAGLTPAVPLKRIHSVGNAAGVGAKLALVSVAQRRKAVRLADRTEHIQLSGAGEFQKAFIQAMPFP